jgi:hypothetical protein
VSAATHQEKTMTDSTDSLALRTLDDVERLARLSAGSGLTAFRRPEAAAVILLTGRELGLSPMASLRGIYEVSGRPVLAADLMVAIVRRSGLCASWRVVASTTTECTIETRREGEPEPERCTWTLEDARRAGCGGGTWQKFPRQMLSHRCAAELARRVYPDVLLGLYTPEEMGAGVTADGVPAATVVEPDEERDAIASEPAPLSAYEKAEALLNAARSLDLLVAAWKVIQVECWAHLGKGERASITSLKDERKAALAPPVEALTAPADVPDWARTAEGQREHLATKTAGKAVLASVAKWGSLSPGYADVAAERLQALSLDADGAVLTLDVARRMCDVAMRKAAEVSR